MSTLSERCDEARKALHDMRWSPHIDDVFVRQEAMDDAIRVALQTINMLEDELTKLTSPDSPTDILKHNYEKLGLSSALVVNNKYGKHSAFGYMGREW